MSSLSKEGNTIIEATDSSGAVLGSDGNIITGGVVEVNMVLTGGEGSAVVVTDDWSAVTILPECTVILGDGKGNIVVTDDEGNTITISLKDAAAEESEGKTIIIDSDVNAVVLVAKGNILGVVVDRNLVYKGDAGNSYVPGQRGG